MSYEIKKFEFEGEQRTVSEVHKMMPVYGIKAIRAYLVDGATTKAQMHEIAYLRQVKSKTQAKKNAHAARIDNDRFFLTEKKKGIYNA